MKQDFDDNYDPFLCDACQIYGSCQGFEKQHKRVMTEEEMDLRADEQALIDAMEQLKSNAIRVRKRNRIREVVS